MLHTSPTPANPDDYLPPSPARSKKRKVRASILVTRWHQGQGGEINGESTEPVSIPVARIKLVEPYAQEIWISLADQHHGPGACRARILFTDGDYIAVTETVATIDGLMNQPLEDDR